MNNSDLYANNWMNLNWSEWLSLAPTEDELGTITTDPGLYRVYHQNRDGLIYIGETGRSARGRVRALARGVYNEDMPFRDPHTAAPCLWAVRDRDGPELKVSFTAPPKAQDKQERKAIEAALIAVTRRVTGKSPTANFGRIIDGYKQSSYRKDAIVGGRLSENETEPNCTDGRRPLPWENVDDITGTNWMGLDWSEPYRLEDRLDPAFPDEGVYKIWYQDEVPPLAYIGETSDFTGRLRRHESTFGSEAFFSVATSDDIEAKHKRTEVETDLIGAHYLTTNRPPRSQF